MKWSQLFVRHGWLLEEKRDSVFSLTSETEENVMFLLENLKQLGTPYKLIKGELSIEGAPPTESEWIEQLDFPNRGRGEHMFSISEQGPGVKYLDTYISGLVRQLNRLGYSTIGSCDGHDSRPAHIIITWSEAFDTLKQLFQSLGIKQFRYRNGRKNTILTFHIARNELLSLTEKLSKVQKSWLTLGPEHIGKQLFYQSVEKLLSIPGESGREEIIRNYVFEQLEPFVDNISTDLYGNVLAQKVYGSGNGPTILLNAHMDTIYPIEPHRSIRKDNNIWYSSSGILGADDRAGVAILLEVAKLLYASDFSGKIKFIFTVEEEVGLKGASHVAEYFLWGTDAAIVVDRRGKGDIVTSYGGYSPFCHQEYGMFIEGVAKEAGFTGWACTGGGSSDTRIWAEHGIQSVNLSAGYQNEHTDAESLDVDAAYETVKLILSIFQNSSSLRSIIRKITRGNAVNRIV